MYSAVFYLLLAKLSFSQPFHSHTHTHTLAHTHTYPPPPPPPHTSQTNPPTHTLTYTYPPPPPPTYTRKQISVIPSTVYSHNLYSVVVYGCDRIGDSSTPALHSCRGPTQRPPPIPEKHTHLLTKKEYYHKHSIYCNTTVTVESINEGS